MKRIENGEMLTNERKDQIKFFRLYHENEKKRKELILDYWDQLFVEPAPIKKYGIEKCYYRVAYELQIRALDSENKEISSKVWNRYEVSKEMSLEFDDELKHLIQLTRGDEKMVKAKVVNAEVEAKSSKKGKEMQDDKPMRRNAVGCVRGVGRLETYVAIFTENFRKKLTDAQLAEEMSNEFPQLKAYNEKDIKSHRGFFNHGKLKPQDGVVPAKSLPEYDDEGNVVVRQRGRKAKESDEADDAPPKKASPKVAASPVPPKVVKAKVAKAK